MSQRNFQLGSQSVNGVSVTVNDSSARYIPASPVTVQPILTQQSISWQQPISKVLLKAVKKKKSKKVLVLKHSP